MPRVVQVPSSETEAVNLYNADSSENEDTVNRNFNQTVHFAQEPIATYMRFPINYALYNVTYLDSENDPYCLRCVIGGRVKKFKKDARTWLHKSSDRKRKMDEETTKYGRNVDNTTANKNMRLGVSDAQQIIACGGTYKSNTNNTDNGNDVLSEISSLGDSEADLTYSEESSPSLTSEAQERYQKTVRFDHNIHAHYRTHSISSDSDESIVNVGKTTSSRNIVFQEELKFMEEDGNDIYGANESRNNVRPGPMAMPLQARIAPAIRRETASLQETLLDRAVNTSSGLIPSAVHLKARRGTKWRKSGGENTKTYNLRSAGKSEAYLNGENSDQIVPSIKPHCRKETSHLDTAVKPVPARMNLAQQCHVIGTDEAPSCSRRLENDTEFTVVPKLFFLASLALYLQMKPNLNKCS